MQDQEPTPADMVATEEGRAELGRIGVSFLSSSPEEHPESTPSPTEEPAELPEMLIEGGTPSPATQDAILHYASHPVDWVKDLLRVTPDPWQGDALNALIHEHHVAIRSGSGVGKSALLSWATLFFLTTRPSPKVPATAPSQHQLFDVLWAEHSKWINQSEFLAQCLVWTKTKVAMRGREGEWFSVARTARVDPKSEVADALQGFHAEHLCYVIDEAPGVIDEVMVALEGALTGINAHSIMAGNPSRLSGLFYQAFHELSEIYSLFHVDSETSPRVSKEWVRLQELKWGRESNVFLVKVKGEFPRTASGEDSLIPLQAIDNLLYTKEYHSLIDPTPRYGLDIARYGKDKSVLIKRAGQQIQEIYEMPFSADEVATAEWVKEMIGPVIDGILTIEVVGYGGGVFDILRRDYGDDAVIGFVPQAKVPPAAERVVQEMLKLGPTRFRNCRAAAWWRLAKMLPYLRLVADHDMLKTDLAYMTYTVDNDVIQITNKQVIRDKLGRSPDFGDALMLTVAGEFGTENNILINPSVNIASYADIAASCTADDFVIEDDFLDPATYALRQGPGIVII